ncbi:hypothetical protein STEG23_020633, partial [Scotinomys teguina]
SQRAMLQLKGRVSELEAELAEQQHLGRQATDDCEFLRTELDELKRQREDTEKAQRSLTEIERKAQANEQRYSKLKEKYSELVQNHADLLRKNAEVTKQVSVARQAQVDLEREKKELEDSFARVSDQAQRKTQEQQDVLENLKHELATSRQELQVLHSNLETSTQSETKWLTQIAELEKEQGSLAAAAAQREEEFSALRDQLESTQMKLASTQESMGQQVKDQRKILLAGTRKAAEREIQEALSQLEEPALISCAGSTDHLLSKVKAVSGCLEQLEKDHSQYLSCPEDISELLHSMTLLAHLTSDTILQGSATSLRAPPEPADSLTEACRQYGRETLAYLASLEEEEAMEKADGTAMRNCLSKIQAIGEDLLPRGLDIKQEELGDLVDKEMAATSAAIEAATARIEEILSKSRAGDTGVKLEVNERILGSCTSLMQAIKVLVVASKDLQKEIVESGRGTASPKEFYAKNSRWTEGLISASKAVGWGATIMVDAADLMVQGKGKFEELMVCSHEIAASTAQLVAASKVKANKGSLNLTQLQQASRGVNQATAAVVASTISGKSQIEETDNMDFSSMTLTQIKRQEMDSQVRVLELENDLQKERQKLGELRKKHYELAGVAEGWEEAACFRILLNRKKMVSCATYSTDPTAPIGKRTLFQSCGLLWPEVAGTSPSLKARNRGRATVHVDPPGLGVVWPEQMLNTTLSSASSNAPDPCAKETVLSALKERKKRTVEEEDQLPLDGQENKRRRHDSSGSGHSAFEPLVANGVPAAFVPKPGSLKRSLASQISDDHLNKRSRTSSVSSLTSTCTGGIPSSSRNAITSSYSSTRGMSQLWKRSGPTSSPFSSPASSRSQTPERPAKKTREEEPCHHSSSSAPLVADKESPGEQDTATGKQQSLWTSPSTPGSSGQRKRKVQLLPSRRGDQLALPPPPELGYSITAEDLDMERRASLQWFNKVLEDKMEDASTSANETPPVSNPPFTFTPPAVAPAASPASLPAPSSNPLLESLKKMQDSPAPPSLEPAVAATTAAPSPPKTPSLLTTPLVSPLTGPLASTSSDAKPTAAFLGLGPASSATPLTDTKSPGVPQTEQSVSTPASSAPSPTPKPSMLFGMLSPPATSSLGMPGPACASPMFKPIFMATPKSESDSPLPSSSSATTTASSSTTLATTASATAPTFKPIFDTLEAFTAMPLSAPFSLKQTAATATPTTTSAPLFTGLGTATSTVASGTTASASKLIFGFGVTTVASTASSTMTSTSQTLFGGAPPVTAASSAPALSSIFQFGKPPATAASAAGTSFSQPPASSAQTVASSSSSSGTGGFSGFGSTLTTSTSAPATSSQPTLTFSSTVTPTFNIPFSSGAKPALPAYPGANPQPTFGATEGATKPALAPSFGSSFTFGNSVSSAPSAAAAPATFGSAAQPAFGGLKATASTFGTPASTQPAFGSTTSVFSFGSATTSGFGASTQTTNSGSGSSLFGSPTPSPFTFGGSAAPGSGGFGLGAAPGTSSTSGTFSFGSGQSGTTGTATSFGGSLSQNTLGTPSQSSPFAFNSGSAPESKPVFGGTATPTFGQSAPAPGVGTAGSSLSFGASSTPAQGFVGVGTFGSAAPSFSIGAGSKTPGARQRLQARRQHTRKK